MGKLGRGDPGNDNVILFEIDVASEVPVIEQLRNALAKYHTRVLDLFKDWDDDGNGMVNKTEFRKALPMLGLKVDRAVAEELFDSFDEDKSGEIDYKELNHHLRAGANIELDAALQDGAAGEIVLDAKNAIAVRGALSDTQKLEASKLQGVVLVAGDAGSVAEQLLKALDKNLMRIIDLFREWDDDDSGTVSKLEFRRALPCLGLRVDKEDADALFDSFDADHSGSVDYNELHRAIKRSSLNPLARSPRRVARPTTVEVVSTTPLKGNWRQAMLEEAEARKRLLRLQREFEKARHQSALQDFTEVRKSECAALRADMARRVGSDVTEKLRAVPTADVEEVEKLSIRFNVQMWYVLLPDQQEWFSLFKAVDSDGSGRISFEELETMIRGPLKLSREKLPTVKLQGLWKALDEDGSGWISTGEFGRFMKLGAQKAADHIKKIVAASKAAKAEEARLVKEETDRLVGRDVTVSLRDVPAANKDEVAAFSVEFNQKMKRILLPHEQEWYRIYKQVDTDRSGRISIDEFTMIVRGTLKYGVAQLTNVKLQGLWKGLDEDNSGWLSAGEFGKFMKLGESKNSARSERGGMERRLQEKRQQVNASRISAAQQEEAAQLRVKTEQAEAQKRAIDAEVARLEADLEQVKGRRGRINFQRTQSSRSTRQPASLGATPRPQMWTDPRPPAGPPPGKFAVPSRQPVGRGASPRITNGKQLAAWVDPTPPPPRDNSAFAVPFGGRPVLA